MTQIVTAALPPPEISAAIDQVRFQVIFNRPESAIPVSDEARIDQLREMFQRKTHITVRYILADVVRCQESDQVAFCITFLVSEHQIARDAVRDAVQKLTPDMLLTIVNQATGIDRAFLEVRKQ